MYADHAIAPGKFSTRERHDTDSCARGNWKFIVDAGTEEDKTHWMTRINGTRESEPEPEPEPEPLASDEPEAEAEAEAAPVEGDC